MVSFVDDYAIATVSDDPNHAFVAHLRVQNEPTEDRVRRRNESSQSAENHTRTKSRSKEPVYWVVSNDRIRIKHTKLQVFFDLMLWCLRFQTLDRRFSSALRCQPIRIDLQRTTELCRRSALLHRAKWSPPHRHDKESQKLETKAKRQAKRRASPHKQQLAEKPICRANERERQRQAKAKDAKMIIFFFENLEL